jgi:hypothetical protein
MTDAPSTTQVHGQTSSPARHLVHHRKPSKHRRMAYGYIIDWDDAEARGKALWSTPEALQGLSRSVELSFVMHMRRQCQAYWPKASLRPVRFQGMTYSCITLADNIGDWNSPGDDIPPQNVIETLKHLLETGEEPKWYKYEG